MSNKRDSTGLNGANPHVVSKKPRLADKDSSNDVHTCEEQEPALVSSKLPSTSSMPRCITFRVESTGTTGSSVLPDKLVQSPPMLKTSCKHDIFLRGDCKKEYNISELKMPEKPAKQYSLSLNSFEREIVKGVERNESVLVAAHTNALKTAITEYDGTKRQLKGKVYVADQSPQQSEISRT